MFNPIPRSVKRIWDAWNIRGLMMFSLFLQTILIMFAPLRKGTANKLIIILIWSVYLLADWAANFAVGLISDSQRDAPDHSVPVEHRDLLAFWPPFLLLHLGGPDTITAFSLEDNELWIRHALGLVFQAVAAVYVFLLSLPNKLAIPTILVFLAGIIKYLERTRALYLASLGRFRDSVLKEPDPGLDFAKLMDNIAWKQKANLPTKIIKIDEKPDNEESHPSQVEKRAGSDSIASKESNPSPNEEKEKLDEDEEEKLDEGEVVHHAYKFFNVFKGLIVDLIFTFHECDDSRGFFQDLGPKDALRVLEVELNFIYEVLYSKMPVVHCLAGYCMRFISFASVMTALSLFHFEVKKKGFDEFDVRITYALFFGAIALETVAFLMIMFSDWTFAALYSPNHGSILVKKIKSFVAATNRWFLIFKRPRWNEFHHEKYNGKLLATPVLFRRWSGRVSGHNLIRYCLKGRPTNFHKVKIHEQSDANQKCIRGFNGCKEIGSGFRLVHFFRFICGKVNHFLSFVCGIFGSTINKVIDFLGLTEFMEEVIYLSHEPLTLELWKFVFHELREKSFSANDPEVAKKIPSERGDRILKDRSCRKDLLPYLTNVPYDQSLLLWHIATELLYHTEEVTSKYREFSKLLSDYMLYLLVMQPSLMSTEAGIGKMRFQDTCAEAKRLFISKNLGSNEEREACEEILDVDILFPPVEVKGDRSKSVLFDASQLAKVLNEMHDIENGEKEDKWELVSKIWVELLSYAACNCIARTHAQQLSRGGELITFVWLLMAHFGLGKQIQIISDQIKIRLIVGK